VNELQRQTLQRVGAVLRQWEHGLQDAEFGEAARDLLAAVDAALASDASAHVAEYQRVLHRLEEFLALLSGTTGRKAC